MSAVVVVTCPSLRQAQGRLRTSGFELMSQALFRFGLLIGLFNGLRTILRQAQDDPSTGSGRSFDRLRTILRQAQDDPSTGSGRAGVSDSVSAGLSARQRSSP